MTTVHTQIPTAYGGGVYLSPSWASGSQRGGNNSYILMPGSTFHLPGYGGVELVSVRCAYDRMPGHVRWYVFAGTIEYGLAQPATDDNTLGDFVEHLGAFKHFGLELLP